MIIGNPSIADVAVQSGSLLVVTGKTFGVTNIIALDADRNVIQDQRVVVTRDEARSLNLTKGGLRQSYSCTPYCSPTLTIGDDTAYFEQISKNAATKTQVLRSRRASAAIRTRSNRDEWLAVRPIRLPRRRAACTSSACRRRG